jgi:hypothetical protein
MLSSQPHLQTQRPQKKATWFYLSLLAQELWPSRVGGTVSRLSANPGFSYSLFMELFKCGAHHDTQVTETLAADQTHLVNFKCILGYKPQ